MKKPKVYVNNFMLTYFIIAMSTEIISLIAFNDLTLAKVLFLAVFNFLTGFLVQKSFNQYYNKGRRR